MTARIFLGLGSNMGDRAAMLQAALNRLRASGISILNRSQVYETPPWGNVHQPSFLNMVIEVGFEGSPMDLLGHIGRVEEGLGRLRAVHWGPREIDIDILAFGDQTLSSQRLTVPHPMLSARAFVLLPWAEIAPDFIPPTHGDSVANLLLRLPVEAREAIHPYVASVR